MNYPRRPGEVRTTGVAMSRGPVSGHWVPLSVWPPSTGLTPDYHTDPGSILNITILFRYGLIIFFTLNERQMPYDLTYKWNLINKTNKQAKYNQRH